MINKIALGTAQFGLDYGVANKGGKVPVGEVKNILSTALEKGVNTLDTAIAYGDSETVLGDVGVCQFDLITKLPSIPQMDDVSSWVSHQIIESKNRLGVQKLKGVLLHRPLELLESRGKNIYDALLELKQDKSVEKIGISVYEPSDITSIIDKYQIDLIQIPFNILDARWDDLIPRLKELDVEIHARSIFLQGLLLMKQKPAYFQNWSELFNSFDEWLKQSQISVLEATITPIIQHPGIDKVVVGIDSVSQLNEVLNSVRQNQLEVPGSIKTHDEFLLNPGLWRLND